jgi:hypothetical protein
MTTPQLSDETKKRIKEIVNYHYGFTPSDEILLRIDGMLRNNYSSMHDQHIIREVVSWEIGGEILKHRDKLGSLEFEGMWHEKSIFKYLTYASMCYRAGIPAGAISLCRTAIEAGIRERLAEELAKREATRQDDLPAKTLEKLHQLQDTMPKKLIELASKERVLDERDVEESFSNLKFQSQSSRKVLDKFIHGDIVWMVDFVRSREGDTRVVGAKGVLQESKIIIDMRLDEVAIEVLRATYRLAALLYFR